MRIQNENEWKFTIRMSEAPNSIRSFSGCFHALVPKKERTPHRRCRSLSKCRIQNNCGRLLFAIASPKIDKYHCCCFGQSTQCAFYSSRKHTRMSYKQSLTKTEKSQICIYFLVRLHMYEGARASSHDHDYAVFILVSILSLCFYRVGSMRIDLVSISFFYFIFRFFVVVATQIDAVWTLHHSLVLLGNDISRKKC